MLGGASEMDAAELRYAKTHEWVSVEGDIATVGITAFAVQLLTDIVYLSLPTVGKSFSPGQAMGEVESVKAVSDIYAPVSGDVVEVNSSLPDNLSLLTESPLDKAWIVRLKMRDPADLQGLLSYAEYVKHCDKDRH